MWSTNTLPLLLFTTGLAVGFGHCIGMCGPIVVSISLNLKGKGVLASHLLYNAGRITTYVILGGLMGITGSFTHVTSSIEWLQKGIMIFAGFLIIIMGVGMGGWIGFGPVFQGSYNPKGWLSRGFNRLSTSGSSLSYYLLGLILGLLPCGPVYTALIAAARSGMDSKNPLEGFILGVGLMLAFGLGTAPSLLLVAKLADLGWLRSREIIYKISSVLMIIVGAYFTVKGIRY